MLSSGEVSDFVLCRRFSFLDLKKGYMGGSNHSQNQTGRYEISFTNKRKCLAKNEGDPKVSLGLFPVLFIFTTLYSLTCSTTFASSFILPHPHPWEELESQLYIQYFFESSQRTLS